MLDMFRFSLKYFSKTFFAQMNIWRVMSPGGNGRSWKCPSHIVCLVFGQNWNMLGERQTLQCKILSTSA
jgi:hypothetical protein